MSPSTEGKMGSENISYKSLKEQFVSDHTGTTATEVSFVMGLVIVVLVRACLKSLLPTGRSSRRMLIIRDHFCLIFPFQLVLTIASDYSTFIFIAVFTLSVFILCIKTNWKTERKWIEFLCQKQNGKLPYISYCRAYVLVNTAISILAVDFTIYPRRFCKAETYGTSVMDAGVGLFIVSNAIVSPEARGKLERQGISSIISCIKSCIPMIVLGTLRILVTKGTDYQEHVTEYGVHWNFFFTLVAIKLLATILYQCTPEFSWKICALAILIGHQYSLKTGLADYIVFGQDGRGGRLGIIDANREGVYSSPGYLVLYIFGTEIGKLLLKPTRKFIRDWMKLLVLTTALSISSWLLFHFCMVSGEPVSRRFVNISYIIWIIALCSQVLSLLLMVDILLKYFRFKGVHGVQTSPDACLLESVNYNGLLYFLLANVLTGLVNVSIKTLYTPPLTSFLIVSVYMFVLSIVSGLLHSKQIKVKFW